MPPRPDDLLLELENLRLTISPSVGASVVSLELRDAQGRWADVLRRMPEDSLDSSDAGSFLMLPWTNRIKDAAFTFHGDRHQLVANHSDGTAIHGVGRDHAWSIIDRSPITARMTYRHEPDTTFPFAFGGIARYEIAPNRVEMDLSITNLDDRSFPAGCGHHPYFHRHLHSDADEVQIRMPVTGRYACRGCIPTGGLDDEEACALLRSGRPLGNPGLDDVFAGFAGTCDLDWDASGVRCTMSCTEEFGHVVVYTPKASDGSADAFFCIEPVTMVNDGFNLRTRGESVTGVRELAPGETLRTRTTLAFSSIS
jgi:aldose 1-epimerase